MLNLLEVFRLLRSRRSESRHQFRLDPLTLLCLVGLPLLLICIFAVLQAEGLDLFPLLLTVLLTVATVGIVGTLCWLVTITKRIVAWTQEAAQLLRTYTPPHLQKLVRLLQYAIRIMAVLIGLLLLAGDTSGLLNLLYYVQLLLTVTSISLVLWLLRRAQKYDASTRRQHQTGQQMEPLCLAQSFSYVQPAIILRESDLPQHASGETSYADYEQPQAHYPLRQMPPF
jgi:hypothetical protein